MINFFKKYYNLIILILILILASFLRLYNLQLTPGWWPDEGVVLNIAGNLAHGKLQMLATSYSFVPHPPLYFLINLPFLMLFGQKLIVMRMVSASIGILSVYFVYLCGKNLKNSAVGLIAAFIFTIFPTVLINSRIALPYHLLTLIFIVTFYCSLQYLETKKISYLFLMALVASLAPVTSLFGLAAIIYVLIFILINDRRQIVKAIILSLIPFFIYIISMLILDKNAFLHDIVYIFNRPELNTNHWGSILWFYERIFRESFILLLGGLGIFLIKDSKKWWMFLFFFLISFLEFRMRGYWWYLSTYTFILMLGIGILIDYFIRFFSRIPFRNKVFKEIFLFLMITSLLVLLVGRIFLSDIKKVYTGEWFGLKEEKIFSPESQEDLQTAVDYINNNVQRDNTVLVSAHLSWLIKARPTDPILSYIYQNKATTNFPDDMRKTNRFLYDPSYQQAKFLLDDKFMRTWFPGQPGIKDGVLNDIYNNWPIVYEKGEFKVYKNPDKL